MTTILDKFDHKIITAEEDFGQFSQEFGRPDVMGWDFETTGLDFMRDKVHGLAVSNQSTGWYLTGEALERAMGWLVDKLEDPNTVTLAHNGQFDMHFVVRDHPDVSPVKQYDTMIAQWLVDENQRKGLKNLAYTYFGIKGLPSFKDLLKETKKEIGVSRMDEVSIYDIPLEKLGSYGALDAWLLPPLWERLEPLLREEQQHDYFMDTAMPLSMVLMSMERNGLYILQDELQEVKKGFEVRYAELKERWDELTDEANFNSPQQLRVLLYDELKLTSGRTTKTGNDSTDVISLNRMLSQDDTGTVKTLLEIRTLDKLLNTYIYNFEEQMLNGYIYGSYNQTGTVTGRLASSNPNLQNIPAHGEDQSQMRTVFGAPPGHKMVVVDYSQVELRIAAHASKDPTLREIFLSNGDPHQTTAELVGADRDKVAKHLNFAWLYGTSPKTFCTTIEKKGYPRPSEDQARQWMALFEKSYPGLVRYKATVLEYAKKLGWTRTIAGRRRHVPNINDYNSYYRGRAERQAFNSIIQGSAGDIINWAMLEIAPLTSFYGATMNSQVHDELVFLVPEETAEPFSLVVQQKMEDAGEHFNISVPIVAEPQIGNNWLEAK